MHYCKATEKMQTIKYKSSMMFFTSTLKVVKLVGQNLPSAFQPVYQFFQLVGRNLLTFFL